MGAKLEGAFRNPSLHEMSVVRDAQDVMRVYVYMHQYIRACTHAYSYFFAVCFTLSLSLARLLSSLSRSLSPHTHTLEYTHTYVMLPIRTHHLSLPLSFFPPLSSLSFTHTQVTPKDSNQNLLLDVSVHAQFLLGWAKDKDDGKKLPGVCVCV